MEKQKLINDILNALPEGIERVGGDIRHVLRDVLQTVLSNMDLVTREEYDTQTEVLEKSLEKLRELEQRLEALEK